MDEGTHQTPGRDAGPPWSALELAVQYFDPVHARAEFVGFQGRIAALAWSLQRFEAVVEQDSRTLADLRRSGEHRVAGWEGESDLLLDETIALLTLELGPLIAGSLIVNATAALEGFIGELLGERGQQSVGGLNARVERLLSRLEPALYPEDAAEIRDHLQWLRQRRNRFVHEFLPLFEISSQAPAAPDFEEADEALGRLGTITALLEEAWERWQDQPRRSDK